VRHETTTWSPLPGASLAGALFGIEVGVPSSNVDEWTSHRVFPRFSSPFRMTIGLRSIS